MKTRKTILLVLALMALGTTACHKNVPEETVKETLIETEPATIAAVETEAETEAEENLILGEGDVLMVGEFQSGTEEEMVFKGENGEIFHAMISHYTMKPDEMIAGRHYSLVHSEDEIVNEGGEKVYTKTYMILDDVDEEPVSESESGQESENETVAE